jgi:hypothetical protein
MRILKVAGVGLGLAVILGASVAAYVIGQGKGHGIGGVLWSVATPSPPSLPCVTDGVGSTVGVAITSSRASEVGGGFHVIAYSAPGSSGEVWVGRTGAGAPYKLLLDSTTLGPGHPESLYPDERIERIRRLHASIYQSLRTRCGLPDPTQVEESIWSATGAPSVRRPSATLFSDSRL